MKRKLPIILAAMLALSQPIVAYSQTEIPFYSVTNSLALPTNSSVQYLYMGPGFPGTPIIPDSPTATANFLDVLDDNTFFPPDVGGAVGPNHVMSMHNSQVRIQNKSGTVLATTTLSNWWSSLGNIGPFDPHVVYDPYNNRWIACAGAGVNGTRSAVLIGVSLTSDPTGSWYLYGFYVDPNAVLFGDYPTLGYNKDKVAVQMNLFNGNTATGTTVFIFDKATMYAGGTLTGGSTVNQLNLSSSSYGFVEYPAQTYDTNLSTFYFLGTWNDNNGAGKGLLAIYTLTGTVASPTFSVSTNFPSAAPWAFSTASDGGPQKGLSTKINTGDSRMGQVMYRNGYLWSAQTIALPTNSPTRTSIQWWQINPTNGAVVQNGLIDDASGVKSYAFGSLAVNKFNDVVIGYSSFSTNQYASASYSFHAFTNQPGVMQTENIFQAGADSYWKSDSSGRNRWGDYSASCVDPSNDIDFWTLQEYATTHVGSLVNGSGRWGTWWAKLAMSIPANDNFTNAITITGSQSSTNGSNVRASRESGEPNHAGNTNTPSVWYNWTVPSNGVVSLTCTPISGLDSVLAVYTGSSVGSLTVVASNHASFGGTSTLTFTATASTTYRIAVAGWNGSFGDFTLNWLQPSAPVFTSQPSGTVNVIEGTNVTFTASAIGTPTPTYQWLFNSTNITGATSSSFTTNNVQTNNTGNYSVIASNTAGSVTSSVVHLQVYISATPLFSNFAFTNNQFTMTVSGITNATYIVQASTNLTDWTNINTNVATFNYTDTTVTNFPKRFFRALYKP